MQHYDRYLHTYLIHNDLIIAAPNHKLHDEALEQVMDAILSSHTTLNPAKCLFGAKEISFWGMIYGENGVKPDPAKVEALDYITAPTTKEELVSFLCMMQSNADFIPNFAKQSAKL